MGQRAKKLLDRSGIQGRVEGEQRNEFNGRELTLMLKTVQKAAHLTELQKSQQPHHGQFFLKCT